MARRGGGALGSNPIGGGQPQRGPQRSQTTVIQTPVDRRGGNSGNRRRGNDGTSFNWGQAPEGFGDYLPTVDLTRRRFMGLNPNRQRRIVRSFDGADEPLATGDGIAGPQYGTAFQDREFYRQGVQGYLERRGMPTFANRSGFGTLQEPFMQDFQDALITEYQGRQLTGEPRLSFEQFLGEQDRLAQMRRAWENTSDLKRGFNSGSYRQPRRVIPY